MSHKNLAIQPDSSDGYDCGDAKHEQLTIRVLQNPSATAQASTQDGMNTTVQRYVFAHIVQGNFQYYQAEDWSEDIALAKASGIDAFAINIGRDETNDCQLPIIYEVAEQQSFAVFLSFDMNYYGQPGSSEDVIDLIQTYATRQSNFIYKGKPLVATFSGEVPGTFLDNNTNYDAAWKSLKDQLGFPIYFLPTWTSVDPTTVPSADGLLSWDAWSPTSSARDRSHLEQLKAVGKEYAAPISPIFYKHLSPAKDGNYIYPTDSWFVIARYLDIISCGPDFVELISWNDYGESHYLRDPQPAANLPVDFVSSETYVSGMSHEPFLYLLAYFNEWYKSATRPMIESARAYMWYRPHPKGAKATSDPLPYPNNASKTKDKTYVVLMVPCGTRLGRLEIISGTNNYTAGLGDYRATEANGMILLFSAPFSAGDDQSLEIYDNDGISVGRMEGIGIDQKPERYNFNYWSGMFQF